MSAARILADLLRTTAAFSDPNNALTCGDSLNSLVPGEARHAQRVWLVVDGIVRLTCANVMGGVGTRRALTTLLPRFCHARAARNSSCELPKIEPAERHGDSDASSSADSSSQAKAADTAASSVPRMPKAVRTKE
jgi:hypothetical protein